MIDHSGAWLPSVWLGVPAIVVGFLVCVGAVVALFYWGDGDGEVWLIAWMPVLAALALIVVPPFGYWPLHGDYHRLQPVRGVVAAVDTRFLAASQYVVVTYEGGLVVRCDDSRCATVRPGEQLRLLCTKEHQLGSPLGVDGWGCRWGQ